MLVIPEPRKFLRSFLVSNMLKYRPARFLILVGVSLYNFGTLSPDNGFGKQNLEVKLGQRPGLICLRHILTGERVAVKVSFMQPEYAECSHENPLHILSQRVRVVIF